MSSCLDSQQQHLNHVWEVIANPEITLKQALSILEDFSDLKTPVPDEVFEAITALPAVLDKHGDSIIVRCTACDHGFALTTNGNFSYSHDGFVCVACEEDMVHTIDTDRLYSLEDVTEAYTQWNETYQRFGDIEYYENTHALVPFHPDAPVPDRGV